MADVSDDMMAIVMKRGNEGEVVRIITINAEQERVVLIVCGSEIIATGELIYEFIDKVALN